MKNRLEKKLISSQKTIGYSQRYDEEEATKGNKKIDYFREPYPSMLIEDVQIGVMPYGRRTANKPFAISLCPSNEEFANLITKGLPTYHRYRNIEDALCHFIKECAQSLIPFNRVVYEIAYLTDSENSRIVGFELVYIPPHSLTQHRDKFAQIIPAHIPIAGSPERYIELSRDSILIFEPPPKIRNILPIILESLSKLGSLGMSRIMRTSHATKNSAYDFNTHLKMSKFAFAQITKEIGWNGRNILTDNILEYYLVYRQLLFEKFKIEIRDTILETLNSGLEGIGSKLDYSGKLEISGLPTLKEIDEAFYSLDKGDRTFKEILNTFDLY
jgi:hypothetical protein